MLQTQRQEVDRYINATIGYVKYFVHDTKKQQFIKGRTISADRLYASI